MITASEKWQKGYTQDGDERLCVAYLDENKVLKAILPLYMEDDLVDRLNALAEFDSPSYLPTDVYSLEKTLRTLYNNMVNAYRYKETAEFIEAAGIVDKETAKELVEFANAVYDKCNAELEEWANLHSLWMGHEYGGMKYSGANPYNMYPSEAYSTPDMYDRVWPERNNILGLAFGRKNFDIVSVAEGYVGKKYIETERNKRSNQTNNNNKR